MTKHAKLILAALVLALYGGYVLLMAQSPMVRSSTSIVSPQTGTFGSIPTCNTGATNLTYFFTDTPYQSAFCNGTAWSYLKDGLVMTPPSASNYAWVNQGGAAEAAVGGVLQLTMPTANGDNLRIRKMTISGKTTLIAGFKVNLYLTASTNSRQVGLCLRESSTSKIVTFTANFNSTPQIIVTVGSWTNATTFSSSLASTQNLTYLPSEVWLKITDASSTLTYFLSLDGGLSWVQVFTSGLTTGFTTAPDEWGYGGNNNNTANGTNLIATLLSWLTS